LSVAQRVIAHRGNANGDGGGDRRFDECESIRRVDFHEGGATWDILGEDALGLQCIVRTPEQDEGLATLVLLR